KLSRRGCRFTTTSKLGAIFCAGGDRLQIYVSGCIRYRDADFAPFFIRYAVKWFGCCCTLLAGGDVVIDRLKTRFTVRGQRRTVVPPDKTLLLEHMSLRPASIHDLIGYAKIRMPELVQFHGLNNRLIGYLGAIRNG